MSKNNNTAKLQAKELKVKIPMEQHLKLHTLKVLKGQNISQTVEAALVRYFDRLGMKQEDQGAVMQALGLSAAPQ